MRLFGCALTHCVIGQETNIVRGGGGERRGIICDVFKSFGKDCISSFLDNLLVQREKDSQYN